jgi:hypothetical protein
MDKDLNRKKVVLVEQKRTSRWLANELGRDERTVSKWCTNKVQPILEAMFAIAKVLNAPVQDLLTNELN